MAFHKMITAVSLCMHCACTELMVNGWVWQWCYSSLSVLPEPSWRKSGSLGVCFCQKLGRLLCALVTDRPERPQDFYLTLCSQWPKWLRKIRTDPLLYGVCLDCLLWVFYLILNFNIVVVIIIYNSFLIVNNNLFIFVYLQFCHEKCYVKCEFSWPKKTFFGHKNICYKVLNHFCQNCKYFHQNLQIHVENKYVY